MFLAKKTSGPGGEGAGEAARGRQRTEHLQVICDTSREAVIHTRLVLKSLSIFVLVVGYLRRDLAFGYLKHGKPPSRCSSSSHAPLRRSARNNSLNQARRADIEWLEHSRKTLVAANSSRYLLGRDSISLPLISSVSKIKCHVLSASFLLVGCFYRRAWQEFPRLILSRPLVRVFVIFPRKEVLTYVCVPLSCASRLWFWVDISCG